MTREAVRTEVPPQEGFQLSNEQVAFFQTFGFLHLRALFKDDVPELSAAFEDVFRDERNERWELHSGYLHAHERRVIIPQFIDKDERLSPLRTDPRVMGIVQGLIGEGEYAESDANLWFCETHWHTDVYGSPVAQLHVKLSFYLDPLTADNGAIRVIPGTHHFEETYAATLRRALANHNAINDIYGVEGHQIPCWTVANEPGDVIIWNQRTLHASYNGRARRRSFAITFREPEALVT
jgi:hypothetical protein